MVQFNMPTRPRRRPAQEMACTFSNVTEYVYM